MRIEVWAVPLSFTCLVVLFGYVTNEAVKLVNNFREKRKTLNRLSTVSFQLVHANPLVSVDRFPTMPGWVE